MAYIGRELQDADAVVDTKAWNNSDTTLTLSVDPGSVNNVAYFEDGVRQVPTTDYTVSGLTLTRTSTPANGVIGMAVSGSTLTIGSPADGTVTNAKIAEDINVANGGTGASTHTANSVLVGEGTSAISSIAPSTSGNVLTSNGTNWTSTAAANASLTGITDNATSTAITIDASENVDIGGAGDPETVGNMVRIDGTGRISAAKNGSNALALYRQGSDGGATVQFHYNTTPVGSISVTASATAFNTSSDYRLKENVVPMSGSIERINQLNPSQFNFISDPDKVVVDGFLAHEAQAVVPESVIGTKDGEDMQGIDQSKLVPLLVGALQEAVAKIEALETRVALLETPAI
jgi:hypothetical protein